MDVYKPLIRSLVPNQFPQLLKEAGEPSFRAQQLAKWIFEHGVMSWDAMSNIPKRTRLALAENFDLVALSIIEQQTSTDGTRKFLFGLRDGNTIESVIIPMNDHATFCISTQVGCAMACRFCATGKGGLVRNLEPGEIIEQVIQLRADLIANPLPEMTKQFNVVFMGMGEPLDNWPAVSDSLKIMTDADGLFMSKRRIQISTSGPESGFKTFVAESPGVGLTLSLGGATDAERVALMPVPGRTTVKRAVELATSYARKINRRITIAWVLVEGKSDTLVQASQLARLVRGKPIKINLIPLNAFEAGGQVASGENTILAFQKVLTEAGVDAFIRASGGQDIDAACGQLRRRRNNS